MTRIKLPCTVTDCPYKTPELPPEYAFQQMANHRTDAHNNNNNNNNNNPAQTTTAPRPAKVVRPCFDVDQTTEKWQYFKTRWSNYKTATGLTGSAVTIHLLETCSENLRFAMFQSDAAIDTKSETDILALMKTLSVKEENVMVARMKLHALHQEPAESIRNFVARIKGQAELCRFEVKCSRTGCDEQVRYTDEIVRDIIIRNIYDQDIQREILGHENQQMLLEPLIKLIEAKETGKRTQANLLGQNAAAAAMSTYKKDRRQEKVHRHGQSHNCGYCGEPGHGRNDGPGRLTMQHRKDKCPAFSTTCSSCNRKGHFTNMCRTKPAPKKPADSAGAVRASTDEDEAGALESFSSAFAEMCAVSETEPNATPHEGPEPVSDINDVAVGLSTLTAKKNPISIDAQHYDGLKGWINKPPSSHPTITLDARVDPADYEHFGYKFNSPPRSSTVRTVTDTGCQSSICGLVIVHMLGYTEADLIPTKMKMKAIDQNSISIRGAIILRLSGRDQSGNVIETVQVCYVSDNIKQLYLSEQGCKQLGIIPETFPAVGGCLPIHQSAAASNPHYTDSAPPVKGNCPCTPRSSVPPLPTELPYSPIEANRLKLENWIKHQRLLPSQCLQQLRSPGDSNHAWSSCHYSLGF